MKRLSEMEMLTALWWECHEVRLSLHGNPARPFVVKIETEVGASFTVTGPTAGEAINRAWKVVFHDTQEAEDKS